MEKEQVYEKILSRYTLLRILNSMSEITIKDVQAMISPMLGEGEKDIQSLLDSFDPVIKKDGDGERYVIDKKEMADAVVTAFEEFDAFTLDNMKRMVEEKNQNLTVQEKKYFENTEGELYLDLYHTEEQKLQEKEIIIAERNEQIGNLEKECRKKEQRISELEEKLAEKASGEKVSELAEMLESILGYTVSGAEALKDGEKIRMASDERASAEVMTDRPAAAGFRTASSYVRPRILNKEGLSMKTAENTQDALKTRASWWKIKKELPEKQADRTIDRTRMQAVDELLSDSRLSNAEKILKYEILTPGLSEDYYKTLNGAANLGIDAGTIIGLLELPEDQFNHEMFRSYVSDVQTYNACNMKRELAQELTEGKWQIEAEVNGEKQLFTVVPRDYIDGKIAELKSFAEKLTSGGTVESMETCEEEPEETPTEEDTDGAEALMFGMEEMGVELPEEIEADGEDEESWG